jgi:hypothetical protein
MTPAWPRSLALFLASRRAYAAVVFVVGAVVAARIAGHWTGRASPGDVILPLATALMAAAVIAGSTGRPFGELELVAARPLAPLRLVHLGLLLSVALAACARVPIATTDRDLVGMTGLGLLTAAVVGARLSWTVPLGYAVVCVGAAALARPTLLVWPLLPAGDRAATAVALGLLGLGLAVACTRSAPEDG